MSINSFLLFFPGNLTRFPGECAPSIRWSLWWKVNLLVYPNVTKQLWVPTLLHSFCCFVASLLRCFVASWLRGFVASLLRGFVASWLRCFVASWLRGFVASWLRCLLATLLCSFVPPFLRSSVPPFLRSSVRFIRLFLCSLSLFHLLVPLFQLFHTLFSSIVHSFLNPPCKSMNEIFLLSLNSF